MSILSPLPDPSVKLRELTEENARLADRVDELETELRKERRKNEGIEKGVAELRKTLTPLYQGLQMMFGHMEAMGVSGSNQATASAPGTDPRKAAVWEDWVGKLGGRESFAGKMIIALLQHGALTSKQIAIHIGTKRMQTVYETTLKVNKAGILDKNGDKFSLKEL
jgi:hypothetical protein